MTYATTLKDIRASRPSARGKVVVDYVSHNLREYASKWDLPLGAAEPRLRTTRTVADDGTVHVAAVPFRVGVDAILDHSNYSALSSEWFPMPKSGSLEFSADIRATTPGTEPGRVVHGSYTDSPDGNRPYAAPTLEGQQAALIFTMTNAETHQLFHWFVSGGSVFAMIERLPSTVTTSTLPSTDPAYVGLTRAYTQIIKTTSVNPGDTHNYAIRYVRNSIQSMVEYLIDGKAFVRVGHVGIPLDTLGHEFTGTYPSYNNAPGEELKDRMDTFMMGHGISRFLDPFPFRHPDAPELGVSIPLAERLFGQGAEGTFNKFKVTTTTD